MFRSIFCIKKEKLKFFYLPFVKKGLKSKEKGSIMKKIHFLIATLGLAFSTPGFSENLFWSFDDNQTPMTIPPECEFKFDEVHGGVFMPTIDELFSYGQKFLKDDSLTVKQQGAYCILGAALQDHAPSQMILARLYEEGKVLPQDDLSAYKWAFIAALNGQKEAERLTLLLEQYLTTPELEKTTASIQETRMRIQENLKKQMEADQEENTQNTDAPAEAASKNAIPDVTGVMPDLNGIFTDADHMK